MGLNFKWWKKKKKRKKKSLCLYSALKENIGVCITFTVFMINLANLEINYQCLNLRNNRLWGWIIGMGSIQNPPRYRGGQKASKEGWGAELCRLYEREEGRIFRD